MRIPTAYANPYRDVALKVTFTGPGGPYNGYGFWDRDEPGNHVFKIRFAFPAAGAWSWSTSCDTALTPACSGNASFNQSGNLTIAAYSGTNRLYTLGYPSVAQTASANSRHFLEQVTGATKTPFFWLGDTTWPGLFRSGPNQWETYLTNRRGEGFTVVQAALPEDWMVTCGSMPTDFNNNPAFDCTSLTQVPNSTCKWNVNFWKTFENRVFRANEKGMAVALVGLMERVIERSTSNCSSSVTAYPTLADSQIYARNVAARLAGSFVITSPAFDRRVQDELPRIQSIGTETNKVFGPKLLITNHMATNTTDAAAIQLHAEPWLDFQMFQSGQHRSACTEDEQLQLLTRDARTKAQLLYGLTSPSVKPNVNGEAIYVGENTRPCCPSGCGSCSGICATHYNDYRARQAAYLSMLSGATGYTFGIKGVFDWSDPTNKSAAAEPTSVQMDSLCTVFRSFTWHTLVPDSGTTRLKNQVADSQQHKKMAVARDMDKKFLLAYLPDNDNIHLAIGDLFSGATFDSTWLKKWYNPRTGVFQNVTPGQIGSPSATERKFFRPSAGSNPQAGTGDWVLVLHHNSVTLRPQAAAECN